MARQFPRVRDGTALTPRHMNIIYAELERWNRLDVAGGSFTNGPTPFITVGTGSDGVQLCRSPGGGIDAISGTTPGSADCTLYTWDGSSFAIGSETITVKNRWTTAVGATKRVTAVWWRGDWWAENWEC
jgi:hypothetical protein